VRKDDKKMAKFIADGRPLEKKAKRKLGENGGVIYWMSKMMRVANCMKNARNREFCNKLEKGL
jgi:hypothetical protein